MNIERTPRPLGLTLCGKVLSQEPSKTNKAKFRNLIIKAFIQGQIFKVYHQSTSLKPKADKKQRNKSNKKEPLTNTNDTLTIKEVRRISFLDLALALGLSEVRLEQKVNKAISLQATGIDKKQRDNDSLEYTRATSNMALKNLLGRYHTMSAWSDELVTVSRLYRYSPMNVKEANSALTGEVQVLKAIFEMATKLGTQQQQTNIQINNLNNSGNHNDGAQNVNGHFLTTTQALQILEEKGFTQETNLDLNLIALKNGLFGPEVLDVKAIPSDAQGVRAFNSKDLIFTNHSDRREHELGIEEGTTDIEVIK